MNLTVQLVPINYVNQTWPRVESFLAKSMSFGRDEYTLDQLKVLILNGSENLLVAVDEDGNIHGAATVAFINHPNHRVAFITAIGGRLITNEDTFAQLRIYFITQGATKIQANVRPVMAKFSKRYGFNEIAALVEVKL
jgi:hypothetical protein